MVMYDGVPWNAEDGVGSRSLVELWVVVVLSVLVEKLSMVGGGLSMEVGKLSMVI